jgi:formate hydrogenlyase subunit 3/multisubunit Na+/H+ antiporter MnhD subunit
MLAGVEASPGNIGLTTQAGTLLGLGFAFLFAIFPLYNWIPMLAEEASPFATGFMLWVLPTFTTIFALGFMDRYTWLRTSAEFSNAMQLAGIFMVASGGILSITQKHIGRIMGYAAIVETGLIILAMTLSSANLITITFLLLIPRGLELAVWALGISIIKREAFSLQFTEVQGFARKYPLAVTGVILAHLSMTGLPLLAGFPARLALTQELSRESLFITFWVFMGLLGLSLSAFRTMAVFVMAEENTAWAVNESWLQAGMLGLGMIGLFILGLFPQVMQVFLGNLPVLFEHLGG